MLRVTYLPKDFDNGMGWDGRVAVLGAKTTPHHLTISEGSRQIANVRVCVCVCVCVLCDCQDEAEDQAEES